MTLEEFRKHLEEEEDWAPGWNAIEEEFSKLYPKQSPEHFGTEITARAIFGGDQYLDGYSIYSSPKGYQHIVTFGMTNLYAEEEALGGDWNRWGYEMTFKLKEQNTDACLWAMDMLSNLARYTYEKEAYFEEFQYISGDGTPLKKKSKSKLTALFCIQDPELNSLNTLYGKTEFIQLFGILEEELEFLMKKPENASIFYEIVKKTNPDFVTDLYRTESYLKKILQK